MQRYRCNDCGLLFQSSRRNDGVAVELWKEYIEGKQTLEQLAGKYDHSHIWVRKQLDTIVVPTSEIVPHPTGIIADTTFWGRHYGVCVFRAWPLKKNIWWHEVAKELMAHYRYGRQILEEKGWTILFAVVDGRRGFFNVFNDIPVQMCQFHQIKIVTRYLTKRPKTEAGKALVALVLTLTKTDEATFIAALADWHTQFGAFMEEMTESVFENGKTKRHHTHKGVYSAYHSLERNLPYLFTYLKYPELNIPNTTNSLDGSFSALKKKLGVHHGLRRDRRYKIISKLLRDGA